MPQYLLMCRSLTYAQRASRILERSGITAILSKIPQSAVESGCNYAIKVSEKRLSAALEILNTSGIPPSRIFMITVDGTVTEVSE